MKDPTFFCRVVVRVGRERYSQSLFVTVPRRRSDRHDAFGVLCRREKTECPRQYGGLRRCTKWFSISSLGSAFVEVCSLSGSLKDRPQKCTQFHW
jgi:hypothetical protein